MKDFLLALVWAIILFNVLLLGTSMYHVYVMIPAAESQSGGVCPIYPPGAGQP